jgi:hypothetical protein
MPQSLSMFYSKEILQELAEESPDHVSPMWPPVAMVTWDLKDLYKGEDKRKVIWPAKLRTQPHDSSSKKAIVEWDKKVILKLKEKSLVSDSLSSVVEVKDWTRDREMIAFECLDSTQRAMLFNASLPTEDKAPWGTNLNLLNAWQTHLNVYMSKVRLATTSTLTRY